jgi:hypothetical protein
MQTEWTDEEIRLATELHEDQCACGQTIWVSLFGDRSPWLELAREIINARPQKETLPLQFDRDSARLISHGELRRHYEDC